MRDPSPNLPKDEIKHPDDALGVRRALPADGKMRLYYWWLDPRPVIVSRHGEEIMKRATTLAAILLLTVPMFAVVQTREQKRLEACGQVLKEILGIPDELPKDLLDKAECVIVIPSVLKLAIGIGGDFGRGAITCRTGEHFTGPWSAPALFALEGGNIGFQLGGEATDFVLLVMNPKGANSILGSKVKLGADASAAAGPKGRTAAADTDIVMKAEVLSYSRSRGLFAGISLEGSTLRSDGSANKKLYGRELSAMEIVRGHKVGVPASGRELIALLNKQSPKNHSDPTSLK
jgi:SH3 domain-containing YSC84-like protein 1